MLRDMQIENLPGYKIALERGMKKGIERGMEKGILEGIAQGKNEGMIEATLNTATTMIKEFHLSVEQVAQKLNIPLHELKKHLSNSKN